MRFNDGRCDRQGRWAGTMVRDMSLARPVGGLYRSAAGLSAPQVQGLVTQNGLAFSPDGRTMYLSDSHPTVQTIWTLPLHDDGTVGERRLRGYDRPARRPDGAAVDAEGCYWICANDAGLVHRFTPDGRLDQFHPCACQQARHVQLWRPTTGLLFMPSHPPRPARGR